MLSIEFLNDGTGDEETGNYRWAVRVNGITLIAGQLKGHNRHTGWEGLVKWFAENLEETWVNAKMKNLPDGKVVWECDKCGRVERDRFACAHQR
jgi:hypothetical protein